jgi:hypothetical protein
MTAFLTIIGVLAWLLAGVSVFGVNGAIHEIFVAALFLIGVLSFVGAALCSKVDDARDEATSQRAQMQDELKAMRSALERMSPPPPADDPAAGVGPKTDAW